MDTKQLIQLVITEAEKLKQLATAEELSRLNFSELNSQDKTKCIYGQMTHDCFSERAGQLINECTERVYKNLNDLSFIFVIPFTKFVLNGKPEFGEMGQRKELFFSPIECFIGFEENQVNGNNEMLINFFHGKIDKLDFKPFNS